MDTFEQELRRRLARREPASDFTARVMAAIPAERPSGNVIEMPRRFRRRWALVGAVAAALAAGVFVWQDEVAEREAARERAELARQATPSDVEAEAQILETLFLTGAKINQARTTVWGAAPPERANPPAGATRGDK